MTVKELIEELKRFDENMQVKITDDNWDEDILDVDEFGNGYVLIQD